MVVVMEVVMVVLGRTESAARQPSLIAWVNA
jgi:hypothetical protein